MLKLLELGLIDSNTLFYLLCFVLGIGVYLAIRELTQDRLRIHFLPVIIENNNHRYAIGVVDPRDPYMYLTRMLFTIFPHNGEFVQVYFNHRIHYCLVGCAFTDLTHINARIERILPYTNISRQLSRTFIYCPS